LSRAQFLLLLGGTAAAAAGCRPGRVAGGGSVAVLRPPAALPEPEFVQRCVRCGNCMKVCLTNVLQPAVLESGWTGIWTPRLVPELGYCEHQCTLCGQVCPTGAIPPLTVEQKVITRIGLAVVHREICIPWASNDSCQVCEEHCPVSHKAIKVESFRTPAGKLIGRPVVDPQMCVGCAICENKCPVRPRRAITVSPLASPALRV
jgi:ferredoxin